MPEQLRALEKQCEAHKGRADDCGQLARAVLAALSRPTPDAAMVERAAWIIQNWRDGNAGEDDASDTARWILREALGQHSEGDAGVNCPDCGGRITTACPHCGAEPVDLSALPPSDRCRELEEAFNEAAVARDEAGFIGTVADCIRYFRDEVEELRALLSKREGE